MLKQARNLAKRLSIIVDLPMPSKTVNIEEKTDPQTKCATKPCYHPWKSVFINEKGDVMPCCATSVVMGNLERSSFYEIWN